MIKIESLSKKYSDFSLSIPDLELSDGTIYGLVGKNGAGKTTLIRCLLGLIPFEGEITFDGKTLENHRMELLPHIAYVSDNLYYSQDMSGIVAQRFTRRYYPTWNDQLFLDLCQDLSINLKKKIKALSEGTKTKLAIALAVAKQPDIFILDEPTSCLDPIVRGEILQVLKKMASERKIVILFSTHILEDVIEIVDEVITINNGSINSIYKITDRNNYKDIIQNIIQQIQ